ncbi:MAG: PRC-barrel domain-containing protein [Rubrobacter sp.]|nr:PRC-barrel domain-containing protein [Rubrobacteraceae bacterium]MBA3793261.1 PRC-barrel domain-containing protein [Rubrobacter sp.]
MASEDRLRELEEKYEGFTVYDNAGSKIGKVDDLFVDETDNEEYIGVKMGFFGSKSTLIPTEIVRINESDRTIEVSESKDHVKDAPSFSDDEDVTGEYEERIRRHFGLETLEGRSGSGYSGEAAGGAAAGATSGTSNGEDREYSDQGSSSTTGDDDHESSGRNTREETYGSSSGAATAGSTGASGYQQGSGESSGSEGYREESGSEGYGTQYGNTESSGSTGSSSGEGSSGSKPTTTRQTEETETFQEGGRTKIRRRIIREEVTDADDQGTNS